MTPLSLDRRRHSCGPIEIFRTIPLFHHRRRHRWRSQRAYIGDHHRALRFKPLWRHCIPARYRQSLRSFDSACSKRGNSLRRRLGVNRAPHGLPKAQKAMGSEGDFRRIDEHIAEARRLLQRQKGLIIRLRAAGVNTWEAQRILWLLESNLRRFEEHRDRLRANARQ